MGAVLMLVGLLLGIVIGAALGYLFARGRLAAAAVDLSGRAAPRTSEPAPPRSGPG